LDQHSGIIAIYLIGFAALHSSMAGLRAKAAARRFIGSKVDPGYFVFFIVITIITIIPLVSMMIQSPGQMIYIIPSPWIWLFFTAQLFVGVSSLRVFLDAPHRFLIRAQLSKSQSPDAFPLGIKGIYCWIRDPFLLSGLLLIWLTPIMTENLLLAYIITTIYLFLGSLHWESRLLSQFKDAYSIYQTNVPRIIPNRKKRWNSCRGTRDE
jgi:protein-S-isoprenylcysteine O-methyltransferase Ste14